MRVKTFALISVSLILLVGGTLAQDVPGACPSLVDRALSYVGAPINPETPTSLMGAMVSSFFGDFRIAFGSMGRKLNFPGKKPATNSYR